MAASYPTSIKSFTAKTDLIDDVMAVDVNEIQDEVAAIETELGVLIKGSFATAKARVEDAEARILAAEGDIATITVHAIAQGRLTLESGVPISATDQTAKTTVYYTPYLGNLIGLYDGSVWAIHAFTERSLSLAGLTANKNHDIFIYNNAGTLTLEAVVWTNDTTRATALAVQDGVYVKSGATSRRYLGTIRTTATTGQCEDSRAKRFVWNLYNQVMRLNVVDEATSHTYTSSSWRDWNNVLTAAYFVCGLAGNVVNASARANIYTSNPAYSAKVALRKHTDTTFAYDTCSLFSSVGTASSWTAIEFKYQAEVGYNYAFISEQITSGGTGTFAEVVIYLSQLM